MSVDLTSALFSCIIQEEMEGLVVSPTSPPGEREEGKALENKSEMIFFKGEFVREVLSWPTERERLFWTSHVLRKNAW